MCRGISPRSIPISKCSTNRTRRGRRSRACSKCLHYVYTGNVHDRDGGSTWCPGCGELLVERDWYELGKWNLEPNSQTELSASLGQCRSCGYKIAGVFEEVRGDWGARRMP